MMGTLEEVRAREGRVIAIGHEGDRELRAKADNASQGPPRPRGPPPVVRRVPRTPARPRADALHPRVSQDPRHS